MRESRKQVSVGMLETEGEAPQRLLLPRTGQCRGVVRLAPSVMLPWLSDKSMTNDGVIAVVNS